MTTEYETHGKLGTGKILKKENGSRTVSLHFHCGKHIEADSHLVDLQLTQCTGLKEAVNKACHALGFLPLFTLENIQGPKALVAHYKRPGKPGEGYATIVKKGIKPLRFALSRIDLTKMGATTPEEALRKTAFQTGTIRLLPTTA